MSYRPDEEPNLPLNGLSCSFDEHQLHHQPDTGENPRKMKPEDYGKFLILGDATSKTLFPRLNSFSLRMYEEAKGEI